jgi:hypothetical protein
MKNQLLTLHGLDYLMRIRALSSSEIARMMGRHPGYRQNVNAWRKLRKRCTYPIAAELAKTLDVEIIDLIQIPDLLRTLQDMTSTFAGYTREMRALREYAEDT